jgi:hypothetical protein
MLKSFLLGERLKGGGRNQVKLESISLPFERQYLICTNTKSILIVELTTPC